MGCGWYHPPYYPAYIEHRSTNDLADEMIRDLTEGVGDTGVKAGIIGEIGVNVDYITPAEERVLRAAARASKATGAAVTTHAFSYPVGVDQLHILLDEGVDPTRIIIGHCDSLLDVGYHEALGEHGAYVQYDGVGRLHQYSDERRASTLAELIKHGYVEQLLLSTDRCWRSDLHAYGGFGYDHIQVNFLPVLREAGVTDEQIRIMTVENPKRVLPF
jgi:phosphotriesterase-related protein